MHVIQDPLFAGYEPAPAPASAPPLSADARRTLRQHQLVAAGVHPLSHTKARPELGTCGTCQWRIVASHGYPKCSLPDAVGRMSHGAASDCRAWWPACSDFKPFAAGQIRCRQCNTIGLAHLGSKTICQRCKEKS